MANRWPMHLQKHQLGGHSLRKSFFHRFTNPSSSSQRPSTAPRPAIDIKHIRHNQALYALNCIERNYKVESEYPALIVQHFEQWKTSQEHGRRLRQQNNQLRAKLAETVDQRGPDVQDKCHSQDRDALLAKAKHLKREVNEFDEKEHTLTAEIENLALALPNLTSPETPRGVEPEIIEYVNANIHTAQSCQSHVHIGQKLDILDFAGAATTSGWGWYFLKNEGAILEQALVQYALNVTTRKGFFAVSPPSMVYSHMASACGFHPRDQGGEQQIYTIARDPEDATQGKPELCLAGTAEIPLAGLKANTDMKSSELPLKIVGSSRCYRAEAGSRGADTKGLYRVHEFTKVEMFGWTLPDGSEIDLFNDMMSIQKGIVESLGLRCRVLEQPTTDLGASAARKQDIEAYFPSRQAREGGWGEVTSTSICTDYQSRRLATRVRTSSGRFVFPHTVNGTAMAIPRILAAILENHWDQKEACVRVPEVLWPWTHGITVIRSKDVPPKGSINKGSL